MTNKKIKYDKDQALAKIKILINQFYQNVGRYEFEDVDVSREELVSDIDEILNDTDISQKHLIMAQFDFDKSEKKDF